MVLDKTGGVNLLALIISTGMAPSGHSLSDASVYFRITARM